MFKNIQVRIIIVIIGVALTSLILQGYFAINSLEYTVDSYGYVEIKTSSVRNAMVAVVLAFAIFSGAVLLISSKKIILPITKLIRNAKEIAEEQGQTEGDITGLDEAFDIVTNTLKENLNEVNRQKQQMEAILLHMTDGIVAFNIDGSIIHINPAASRMLQVTSKEDNFEKIFGKLNTDINMERIIYLEEWTSKEEKAKIGERDIKMYFMPFKDENGRAAGVMVLIQDITELIRLDNMRKEFVADVSHELKTPLTSIMGYSETLQEGDYDKELRQKFLKVINSEAIRMAKLVNDLLSLSKLDNDKEKWVKTEFDLGTLVKKSQEKLQIEMDKKKIKAECFVTANVPKVYLDKDGIERVVLNILSNSVKYTKEGGRIKIYVGFLYNDAYIKIIDNGMGIPEEDLTRIFERFYRVDKARTRTAGGTGLRIVYCKRDFRQKWRKNRYKKCNR